jgi:hypothetical protein
MRTSGAGSNWASTYLIAAIFSMLMRFSRTCGVRCLGTGLGDGIFVCTYKE